MALIGRPKRDSESEKRNKFMPIWPVSCIRQAKVHHGRTEAHTCMNWNLYHVLRYPLPVGTALIALIFNFFKLFWECLVLR